MENDVKLSRIWASAIILFALVIGGSICMYRAIERDEAVAAMENGYEKATLPGSPWSSWVKAAP